MTITSVISSTFINITAAIAILLIGLVFARFFVKLTQKIIKYSEINKIIYKKFKTKISIEKPLSNIVKYLLYVFVIILALNQIGITKITIYILLIFLLILSIIFLTLSIIDFIPNSFSKIFINKNEKIEKGKKISFSNINGKIVDISLTKTKIITKDKNHIIIPNSVIKKNINKIKTLN